MHTYTYISSIWKLEPLRCFLLRLVVHLLYGQFFLLLLQLLLLYHQQARLFLGHTEGRGVCWRCVCMYICVSVCECVVWKTDWWVGYWRRQEGDT